MRFIYIPLLFIYPLLSFSQNEKLISLGNNSIIQSYDTVSLMQFAVVDIEVIDSSFCELKLHGEKYKIILIKPIAIEWINPISIKGKSDSCINQYIDDINSAKYYISPRDTIFENKRYRVPFSTEYNIPNLFSYRITKDTRRFDIDKKYKYYSFYSTFFLAEKPKSKGIFSTKEEKKIKKAIKKRNKESEKGK